MNISNKTGDNGVLKFKTFPRAVTPLLVMGPQTSGIVEIDIATYYFGNILYFKLGKNSPKYLEKT